MLSIPIQAFPIALTKSHGLRDQHSPTTHIVNLVAINRLIRTGSVLTTLAASSISANAALTVLYSTNFNNNPSPPPASYSDGVLIGQDGWVNSASTTTNPVRVANTATNGNVTLATEGQDVERALGTSVSSGSVFLSSSISVASGFSGGDYFLYLKAGPTNVGRVYVRSSGAGYQLGVAPNSSTITYGTGVFSFGVQQSILMEYKFVLGLNNDVASIFVNPTSESGSTDVPYATATASGTSVNDASTISLVGLRQGTDLTSPVVTIDNIVVSVPEPSAMILGSLGMLGLLRRRR